MYLIGQYFFIILKFIIPLFMPFFPFQAVWSNYVLDVVDGDILGALGLPDHTYQLIDKTADYWSYIFMLIVAWRWKIRKTALLLFIYRSVGQLLYFTTGNELALFYFQNFLEPLLMIYTLLIFRFKSEAKAYTYYKKHWLIVWSIIVIYKVWNEWMLHFANIDLSTLLFGINGAQ